MRKKIVAGNWKMNKDFSTAEDLLFDIKEALIEKPQREGVDVIVCPPFPFLELATDAMEDGIFYVGAQNCAAYESGAYTGEVSAEMLSSMEVSHVIIGHSERRKYFSESSDELLAKVTIALQNEVVPIFCCGESLEERESNSHFDVIKKQLEEVVFKLNEAEFSNIIIAYEPVWAIGTGKTATTEQAEEMLAYIRNLIKERYSNELAEEIHLLYGGSCNDKNAKELFSCTNVDGGLIGGAALDKDKFLAIIYSA